MTAVTVRRATVEDAPAIARFAEKLFLQHRQYDQKRFTIPTNRRQMQAFYGGQTKNRDAAVLVAEIETTVVGFAYVQYEAINYADLLTNAAWLHDIYVDETARGHEAGKLLLESAVKIARQWGADKLMLATAARNARAREFFERNGFQTTMVEMMLDLTKQENND